MRSTSTASQPATVRANAEDPPVCEAKRADTMLALFERVRIAAAVAVFCAACGVPGNAAPIPQPADLRPVQNRQDCAFVSTAASAACDAAVRSGKLQLLWDEPAGRIDGYKIYRVDGQRHVFISRSTNGIAPAFALIVEPRDGWRGKCYTVAAYLGSNDSADSARYCVTAGAIATSKVLSADRVASLVHWAAPTLYAGCRGSSPAGELAPRQVFSMTVPSGYATFFPWLAVFSDPQLVGSTRQLNVAFAGIQAYGLTTGVDGKFVTSCPASVNALAGYAMVTARTGLDFNLGWLVGHKVYSAILTIESPQAVRNSGNAFAPTDGYSCATSLAVALTAWWSAGGMPYIEQGQARFGSAPVPRVTLDVTPIVDSWAGNGDRNDYGFILRSYLEDGRPVRSFACMTRYENPRLAIVYF